MRMQVKAIVAVVTMMLAAGVPVTVEAANALTSATVNFRASPKGAVFGSIPNGTPVTVLARSGNWCQTEWGGRIGWVYCRYLTVGVTAAPRYVMPAYPYDYEPYPYLYAYPGLAFGFGLFDDGYWYRDYGHRYRDYRPRRHGDYRHRNSRGPRDAAPRFWRDGGGRSASRGPSVSNRMRSGSAMGGRGSSGGWAMGGRGSSGGYAGALQRALR
jgi:uncharacterized protein YraI